MVKPAIKSTKPKGADSAYVDLYRYLDLILGVCIIICLSPLFVCVAMIVFCVLGRPIFFIQKRSGLHREFFMIKFRTMKCFPPDCREDNSGNQGSTGTTLGQRTLHILRYFKFDEMPQLWNVLRGEMSLVGPRPEQPQIYQEICQEIPEFRQRLEMKPGITGWAQIQAPDASAIDDALHKLEWDLYYMHNQSPYFYLQILIRTVMLLVFQLPLRKLKQTFHLALMRG